MTTANRVELLEDWPQPGTGNAGPLLQAGHGPLLVAYDTPNEEVAVVQFPVCQQFIYGHPNDETLSGHPLYSSGLKHYSVYRVSESSRIKALERANSVHPRHDASRYRSGMEHYVFTFQDGTLECLVEVREPFQPRVTVCASWAEAKALIGNRAA
jgi:hypothetical protein